MSARILVDTGPMVAALNRRDTYHQWAVDQFQRLPAPLFTCEAVLTESVYLIRRNGGDFRGVLGLVQDGAVSVRLSLETEAARIQALMIRYHDTPMDLADACLVRMAERYPNSQVLTLDSDFYVYRKVRSRPIEVVMP